MKQTCSFFHWGGGGVSFLKLSTKDTVKLDFQRLDYMGMGKAAVLIYTVCRYRKFDFELQRTVAKHLADTSESGLIVHVSHPRMHNHKLYTESRGFPTDYVEI